MKRKGHKFIFVKKSLREKMFNDEFLEMHIVINTFIGAEKGEHFSSLLNPNINLLSISVLKEFYYLKRKHKRRSSMEFFSSNKNLTYRILKRYRDTGC